MAKKDKSGIDKIRKKLNKEVERTSSQIETLISEALKQLDGIQHQIQEPVKKLIDDIERIRDREMTRFHDEFERRMSELQDVQSAVLERLGVGSKSSGNDQPRLPAEADTSIKEAREAASEAAKSTAEKVGAKSATVESSATKVAKRTADAAPKPSPKKPTTTKSKPSSSTSGTGAKAQPRTSAKSPNSAPDEDLTRIKGIGPVTANRLKDKGILRIQQVANPSEADQKVLEEFKTGRGLEVWQENARSLS